jgi:multidrug efflux pump subunit AcrA (membrane-fusion protein)
VAEGDPLVHIVHQAYPQITVSLSKQQWYLLAEGWGGQLASVRDTAGIEVAKARIMRGGGFLDPETRQYKLFLETVGEETVLSGDFVQVVLPGRIVSNSLAIPESALTRDGKVWYLDDDDRLRTFVARVRFHDNDQIIVDTPTTDTLGKYAPSQWRVATTPMVSFLTGNRVDPIPVESE